MADRYSFNPQRLQALARAHSNVAVSVHDHENLSPVVAKVIVSVSTDRCTKQEVANAVTVALGGNAAPVLDSFRLIPGAGCLALAGFVVKQPEVVYEDDERFKRMRPVTAGIMLDSQDQSMWDVRQDGGKTLLVRAGDEDLSCLLETASVRNVQAPRMASLATDVQPGEFASFVDVNSGELRHGFVLAAAGGQVELATDDSEVPVVTCTKSLVEIASLNGGELEVAASVGLDSKDFDSRSKASMLEFYKQLYGYAPGYVDEIKQQIESHAAV